MSVKFTINDLEAKISSFTNNVIRNVYKNYQFIELEEVAPEHSLCGYSCMVNLEWIKEIYFYIF